MISTDGKLKTRKWLYIPVAFAVLAGLYLLSLRNYLLFHMTAELFSISVAFAMFLLVYNTRQFAKKDYVTFIGIAFLFIGIIDLFHAMAYKGMGLLSDSTPNNATQFWVAGRFMQSLSFIAAVMYIKRTVKINLVLAIYSVTTGIILLSILVWKIFPAGFIEPTGVTPFKTISEYLIMAIFALSIFLLIPNRSYFEKSIFVFLVSSLVLSILSEFSFSSYANVYGPANIFGHFFKILAFYLIYRALVKAQLIDPYGTLFHDLKLREDELAAYGKRLEYILDHVPDGIYIANQDYLIEYANPAVKNVYGNFEGKKCFEYFEASDTPCKTCNLSEIKNGRTVRSTYQSNATGRIFDSVEAPFVDYKTGEIFKFKCIHDITEQKKAELALRKSVNELEDSNRLMIGRECRMIELKKEINELCGKLGIENRYIDLDKENN